MSFVRVDMRPAAKSAHQEELDSDLSGQAVDLNETTSEKRSRRMRGSPFPTPSHFWPTERITRTRVDRSLYEFFLCRFAGRFPLRPPMGEPGSVRLQRKRMNPSFIIIRMGGEVVVSTLARVHIFPHRR